MDLAATPSYWREFPSLHSGSALEASRFELGDGTSAHLYEAGDRRGPNVILVSPSESPFLIMSGVFAHLAATCRVTAWEHPDSVYLDAPADLPPPTLRRMSDDLLAIIGARATSPAHLVSWCTGALTVLWAMARAPKSIASATFIAPPSVLGTAPERSAFQSHFLQMILELASGQCADEAALCERILAVPKERPVLSAVDAMIARLTRLPIRDEVALRRYSQSILDACLTRPPVRTAHRDRAYVQVVADGCRTIPLALLHCKDDDIVSYQCSSEVAAQNDNVKLVLYPRGGHFVIFKEPRLIAADIHTFVNSQPVT